MSFDPQTTIAHQPEKEINDQSFSIVSLYVTYSWTSSKMDENWNTAASQITIRITSKFI